MLDSQIKKTTNLFDFATFEELIFDCPKHGAVKLKVFKGFDKKNCYCKICREEELQKQKQEQAFFEKIKRAEKSGVRKRHLTSSFKTYVPQNQKAQEFLEKVKYLVDSKSTKSVLLYGNSGTGKTHLSSVAVIELGGVYTTWEWLSIKIRASYSKSAKKTEADILKELCETRLLVIDEIDKGTDSENKKMMLSFICRERYENRLPTWLVGNCNGAWVKDNLDSALIDRLKAEGISLCFDWDSYRSKGEK